MSEALLPDTAGELLLMSGCTEQQIAAMEHLFRSLENHLSTHHLSVVGLRALAHCEARNTLEKHADAIAWFSGELLRSVREQHGSIAGLLGKRTKERKEHE